MRYFAPLLALSLLLVACGDEGSENDQENNQVATNNANDTNNTTNNNTNSPEPIREGATSRGLYYVAYETTPPEPAVSEDFTMTVRVFTDDTMTTPAEAATELAISASMPDHGHGMNTTPVVTLTDPGVFLVEGMNFHMPGHWLLDGTLTGADDSDTDTFRFHVEMR